MTHHRFTRAAAIAVAVAALAAPSAVAQSAAVSPAPIANGGRAQPDLRSPDAIDAASPPATVQQDGRSPDTRDAAEGRGAANSPEVVVVKLVEPRVTTVDGFHWADAAIGAGTLLGLILLAVGGGAIAVVRRRRRAASRVTGLSSGAGSGVERRARGRRAGARRVRRTRDRTTAK
jgi:hypothetical protein